MSEEDRKDLIISWSEQVAAQSSDLWTVALALLVAQTLVIATLHASEHPSDKWLITGLYGSTLLSFSSLVFGYFVKGSVIGGISEILASGSLDVPAYPAFNAVCQVSLFMLALMIFVFTFGFFRKEVSRALLGLIRGQ